MGATPVRPPGTLDTMCSKGPCHRLFSVSGQSPDMRDSFFVQPVFKFTLYAIGGVAERILPPQKSPPLQLPGCVELWLPHTSCPECSFLVHYSFAPTSGVTRAMVHVRRARRCPSSDTTLYEVLNVTHATPPTPRVLPRWWIPVGGRGLVWRAH